jgi:hypothetical protein
MIICPTIPEVIGVGSHATELSTINVVTVAVPAIASS